jgi:tRNA threonylcarbamoyladenosine biosynthesis protein TsaE
MKFYLKRATDLQAHAAHLSTCISPPFIIFLSGSLGAGKTTFVRGFLKGLGFKGRVKSPTFTLVEEYFLEGKKIYHFDFYRVHDPEELAYIGLRDYFEDSIVFVEWPEYASVFLPSPDLAYHLKILKTGRELVCESASKKGSEVLNRIS